MVPSSVTTCPSTVTRPAVMSASAARREATPRAARMRCKRSIGGVLPNRLGSQCSRGASRDGRLKDRQLGDLLRTDEEYHVANLGIRFTGWSKLQEIAQR